MKNKVKALLFDFDGVIVDTFKISYDITQVLITPPPSEDEYRHWFDGNIYEQYDNEEGKKGEHIIDDDDPFFKIYIPKLMEKGPIEGVVNTIKKLHKNYRMAIVSSTLSSPIEAYLTKHDLMCHFDKVYGSNIHKSKVVKIKIALADLGLNENDCIFITDTLGDMREAQKVGVKSLGVSWGFQGREFLEQGSPLAIVDSPGELFGTLQNL